MAAVLVITTHGGINVKIDSETGLQPDTTVVPENVDVVVMQAAVCGVVNIVPPEKVEFYTSVIRDGVRMLRFCEETSKENMMSIAKKITDLIQKLDDQPDDVAREISARNPNYVDDTETLDYHHHVDKFYNVYSDARIIDKRFSRANADTDTSSSDWKINLLGTPDEDLMETLNPNVSSLRNAGERSELSVVYMRDVIQELRRRRITKIMIFDFTCSVIENQVSERDKRSLRRSSATAKLGGKRTFTSVKPSRVTRRTFVSKTRSRKARRSYNSKRAR
jgi:hypothetical protein